MINFKNSQIDQKFLLKSIFWVDLWMKFFIKSMYRNLRLLPHCYALMAYIRKSVLKKHQLGSERKRAEYTNIYQIRGIRYLRNI